MAAARPKAASRVAGIETRAATRGVGEVIELDLAITVYPPRDKGAGGGRSGKDGERQQCESVSQEKLAAKLEKVRQRLSTGAANMTKPGADLIAWYLNPVNAGLPPGGLLFCLAHSRTGPDEALREEYPPAVSTG